MIAQEMNFFEQIFNAISLDADITPREKFEILCELTRLDPKKVWHALEILPMVNTENTKDTERQYYSILHAVSKWKGLKFSTIVPVLLAKFPEVIDIVKKPWTKEKLEREIEFDNKVIAQITGLKADDIQKLREIPWKDVLSSSIAKVYPKKFADKANSEVAWHLEDADVITSDSLIKLKEVLKIKETDATVLLATMFLPDRQA